MTANHENVSILSKMPLITNTSYTGPSVLFNGHLQTIFPALFRKHLSLPFDRERITTPDGDFLDLDWLRQDSKKLVIICHGLEGDSRRPYMRGMAKHFFQNKYDVLTWNFRGCSGELNIRPFFYHSGATYDLETVVNHAAEKYAQVYLIGFSLGGNLTLKYLGEPLPKSSKIKKGRRHLRAPSPQKQLYQNQQQGKPDLLQPFFKNPQSKSPTESPHVSRRPVY